VSDFDLGENETQLDFYLKRRAVGSGDELVLTDRRLVVVTPGGEESYALNKLALVRTGFAFSTRAITRGIILIIIGLLIGWLLPMPTTDPTCWPRSRRRRAGFISRCASSASC
jgi:hypothetical protein